jgi:hypothetical protein
VPEYWIYLVGSRREILAGPMMEQFAHDDEAAERAGQLASETAAAEVWSGSRLVCYSSRKRAALAGRSRHAENSSETPPEIARGQGSAPGELAVRSAQLRIRGTSAMP